jgi:hypothetical protein
MHHNIASLFFRGLVRVAISLPNKIPTKNHIKQSAWDSLCDGSDSSSWYISTSPLQTLWRSLWHVKCKCFIPIRRSFERLTAVDKADKQSISESMLNLLSCWCSSLIMDVNVGPLIFLSRLRLMEGSINPYFCHIFTLELGQHYQ